jgi:pre-mRNA-processing factor SLU7
VQKLQLFAWGAEQQGGDMNLQANPTAGELLHQEFKQTKEVLKGKNKVSILDKYGGEEYLEQAPRELLQGQTEEYVEYSRTGQMIYGKERVKARSKYPEDGKSFSILTSRTYAYRHGTVLINNHTCVWGSWYDPGTGIWGYACCRSSIHASYCAGQAGIDAAKASSAQELLAAADTSMPPPPVPAKALVEEEESLADGDDRRRRADAAFSKKRVGEGDVNLDKSRLAKALDEERKRKAMRGEDDDQGSGKRRKGGKEATSEVTEEEMGKFNIRASSSACLHIYDRGLPDEAEQFRGSYGKLCRRGLVNPMCFVCTTTIFAWLGFGLMLGLNTAVILLGEYCKLVRL